MEKKRQSYSLVQIILTVLFVSCFLISNILAVKQIQLPFGITMTSAVYIFPIVYILSDVFSEVYGYKWSRMTCYMAFAMNILMVVFFELAIITKAPAYYTMSDAVKSVLGSSFRTLVASLTAYVAGDFVNDVVFREMKKRHKSEMKGFGLRAILSSLCGEIVDSSIFIPIAFIGLMPTKNLIIMGITQVVLKVAYEIIILPFTSLTACKLTKYERNA